ncbi:MAG: ABC transporter permease [Planctomycetota bacterium]
MNKILRVARTEYLNLVRSKAFLIGVMIMPIFMGGALVVQATMGDKEDIRDRPFAVVDRTGALYEPLRAATFERNRQVVYDEGKKVKPKFVPLMGEDDPLALSDRVREGELFAFVVIGRDAIDGDEDPGIHYYSRSPTFDSLPDFIQGRLNEEIRRIRFESAGIDQERVRQLNRSRPVERFGLLERTEAGEVRQAERVDRLRTFLIPMATMMLLFMLVMMAAPAMMNNVLEEKIQRISEILISSVSSFELFFGKLLATVFVSWTLSVLYLGGIAYVIHRFGLADAIPVSLYLWFLFFQFLALLIFGSISSAIGAACTEMRDAQSMMGPFMLVVMIPLFVWMPVLKNPDAPFAIVMSLIPPATPFLMLLRIAVPPGPALWELGLAVVLSVGFTVFCVWAAAKVFRIGVLSQGQAPSVRKLMGWVFALVD